MRGWLTNGHAVSFFIRKHFKHPQLNYRSIKESQELEEEEA